MPRYQLCLRRANLNSKRAINSLRCVEDALQHFQTIDLDDVPGAGVALGSSRQFPPVPQRFFNPLKHPSKVAVLTKGFSEIAGLRIFDDKAVVSLEKYQPEILAAPVSVLRHFAATLPRASLARPRHAVVAFTGIEEILDAHDRDLFWRNFGVPLFEQYVGLDGKVFARECEIHDGLHIVEEHAVIERYNEEELLLTSLTDIGRPTLRLKMGISGMIEKTLCECGRVEPRLTAVSPLRRPSLALTAVA
ncbi:MAG: hypothetical protein M3Z36_08185 [Acidobacteriota bacterium]|nr:hypothetical protein [Acidobacteriota bacterium]